MADPFNLNHYRQTRRQQRDYVTRLALSLGLDFSQLARRAGVAASTVTRFMNNDDVTHLLTARTLGKLAALGGVAAPGQAFPPDIGRRMEMARQAILGEDADGVVASSIGWSVERMAAIFIGSEAPSWDEFRSFARRARVTSDFLLFGLLDGLPRRSEARLLSAFPSLVADPEGRFGHMDTDRV